MKNSTILSSYVKYVSLNIIAMTGLSCYILADTFFVSNGVGTDGLTALNLAIPVYSFINGTGLMIGIGAATKYAVYKAQNKHRAADEVFTHAVGLGAATGVLFLIAGMLFSETLSSMLGSDTVTFEMTNTYLKTLMCFSPAFIINNILIAFIRNDGAPNLSMTAMVLGSLSNIILDYVFIYPCKMGMFGAAFATGLAPVISMLVMGEYLGKKKNQFHLVRSRMKFSCLGAVCLLGMASFITEASSGSVIIVFNRVILKLSGNTGVAAYGIIANLALVATAVFTGIAQGIQPIVSSNYGQGNEVNIRRIIRLSVGTSLLFAALIYLVVAIWADPVAGIFNGENNVQLGKMAVSGLRIYFTGFFFAGLNIVLASWFGAIERPVPSFMISILRGCIIMIPLLFLLAAVMGIQGVWMAYPLAEVLTFLGALAVYMHYSRSNKSFIRLDKS